MIARYDLNAGTIQGDPCTINCCPEELGRVLGKSCHLHDGSIICVVKLPREICSHRSESWNELRSRLVFFRLILSVVGWLKGCPDS